MPAPVFCLLLLLAGQFAPGASVAATDPAAPADRAGADIRDTADVHSRADVRLILDVSAGMGRADPENYRGAALELLLRLLPEDGQAGVWTYGKFVNMLVKHGPSDRLWKENAVILTRDLESVGHRANLLEAVETATWDRAAPGRDRVDLILLTDGNLDVSDDPGIDAAQKRRLLGELAPELATAGYRIHALTLSDQADAGLLGQLAALTGGYHGRLSSPRQLPEEMVELLGWVAAPAQLPVAVAGTFQVAPGVRELTVLRLGGGLEDPVILIDPLGNRLERTSPRTRVRWHVGESYEMATLEAPAPGLWRLDAADATRRSSRVFAYSDLSVAYADLPATLFPGRLRTFAFDLVSDGVPVQDPEFLELLSVSATLDTDAGTVPLVVEVNERVEQPGRFRVNLLGPHEAGDYRLETRVRGPTFAQTLALPLVMRNPLSIEVRPREDGVVLWARVEAAELDHDRLRLAAIVKRPPGAARLVPVERHPAGLWKLTVPGARGVVEIELDLKGNYLNDRPFELRTQPIRLVLPVTGTQQVNLGLDGRPILVAPPSMQPADSRDPGSGAAAHADAVHTAPAAEAAASPAPPPAAGLMAPKTEQAPPPGPEFPSWLAIAAGLINLLLGLSAWWLIGAPRVPAEAEETLANLRRRLGIEDPETAGDPTAGSPAVA